MILVGGGSRSGKSNHALGLARRRGGRLAFIATAEARDEEMRERIAIHRTERSTEFVTIEEPIELADALESHAQSFDAIVIDCLTLWLSNLLADARRDVVAETGRLLRVAAAQDALIVLVTNEVGCGIVPENALARRFRDLAGRINQEAAVTASEVYWMVFGCPLRVK